MPYGRIVECAFIEDNHEARVVSRFMQSNMSVVVVKTLEQQTRCHALGASSAALDLIVSLKFVNVVRTIATDNSAACAQLPYQVKLNGQVHRERTEEEKAQRVLPGLPSLDDAPGNPRYLINELHLSVGNHSVYFFPTLRRT